MFEAVRNKIVQQVQRQVEERARQASRQMRLAAILVLRKRGRSSPGQPPGRRTGQLARSWKPVQRVEKRGRKYTVNPGITTDVFYARFLEKGTQKMDERPFIEEIKERAWSRVAQIYTRRRYLR